jgi:hypothetical protein
MELKDLEKMTVIKLREEAAKYEDIKGASGMKKEQLIEILAEKLGIEVKPLEAAPPSEKQHLKKQIKALKVKRDEALQGKDYKTLKQHRRQIRNLKRQIRKQFVKAPSR